ncbi:hypothetical protein [Asaia astilbis]|uniref:hypothetical protein n=1 Tax=Asaia astilbis TaxID=610244 RepID=UPI0006841827|nr:hypothetical protein [Asaia astilbis]
MMLTRLAAEGYVHRRPYRGVFLNEKGRSVADETKNRRRIVENISLLSSSTPQLVRFTTDDDTFFVQMSDIISPRAEQGAPIAAPNFKLHRRIV